MPATPPAAPEKPNREAFTRLHDHVPARGWLQSLTARFGLVQVLALGAGREDEAARDILALYVEPSAAPARLAPEQLEEIQAARLEGKPGAPELPAGLLSQLADHQRLVLLGDPGTGKSTLVAWLATCLASPYPIALPPEFSRLVPVPLILRDLSPLLPPAGESLSWDWLLATFLQTDAAAPLREHPGILDQWLASGQAWIMADGFDEISDPDRRRALRDALWEGMDRFPKCRWLVTSRVVGYEEAEVHVHTHRLGDDQEMLRHPRWPVDLSGSPEEIAFNMRWGGLGSVEKDSSTGEPFACVQTAVTHLLYLTPFHDGQVREFLLHWFQPRLGAEQGRATAAELIAALGRARDTRLISRVPNVLTLIALLWRQFYELPSGRTELYTRITDAWSRGIPRLKKLEVDYSHGEKHAWLAAIGWELQNRRSLSTSPDDDEFKDTPLDEMKLSRDELRDLLRAELEKGLASVTPEHEASIRETLEGFLTFVTRTSGLLYERSPGHFGFTHLSFQEYYAAAHARTLFQRALTDSSRPGKKDAYTWTHLQADLSPLADCTAWRETGIFLAELLSADPALEHPAILIEQVLPSVLQPQPPKVLKNPRKHPDPIPYPAAALAASLSHNPRVALPDSLRHDLWLRLWQWHFWWVGQLPNNQEWNLAPALLGASQHQPAIIATLSKAAGKAPGTLKVLALWHCPALTTADGLPTSLRALSLEDCTGLSAVDHLPGSLTGLWLAGCTGLSAVDQLPPSLTELSLSGCTGLSAVDQLPASLKTLRLNGCTGLSAVDQLPASLKTLSLTGCTGLSAVDQLPTSLETLWLHGCTGLSAEAVARVKKALPKCAILGP